MNRRELLRGGLSACVLGCGPRVVSTADFLKSPSAELDLSIAEVGQALRARNVSAVELTRACLARIESFDPRLGAFITVTSDRAIADAERADRELGKAISRGPLHGIPIAVKDNIDTAGIRTTAGSAVFADRIPTRDADVITALDRAGAVLLGKLNMHELALGTTSAISHFGPVRNPWDTTRVAGGSSGGSGAAVAARLCFAAVGTDTGGSVRIPAACCGVVGFKPTYGLVSTVGTIPLSPSFDHVGPLTRTVTDAALMFQAMTGRTLKLTHDLSSFRLGVLRTNADVCDGAAIDPEIQAAFEAALAVLRPLVARVQEADLPMPSLGKVIDAEAYAFHAATLTSMPERYDQRTRKDLAHGASITAAELEQVRRELAEHRTSIRELFTDVDLVIIPTLPVLPPTIREATEPFALSACTFGFSMAGLPAISVPCGFTRAGLPIGLMIGGAPLADGAVLSLALAYEQRTTWRERRPGTV